MTKVDFSTITKTRSKYSARRSVAQRLQSTQSATEVLLAISEVKSRSRMAGKSKQASLIRTLWSTCGKAVTGVQARTPLPVILSLLNALIVLYVLKGEEVQRMRMLDEAFVWWQFEEAQDSEHVAVRCHSLQAHDLCCCRCLDQRAKSMRQICCLFAVLWIDRCS